jgi:hypothetical protein
LIGAAFVTDDGTIRIELTEMPLSRSLLLKRF